MRDGDRPRFISSFEIAFRGVGLNGKTLRTPLVSVSVGRLSIPTYRRIPGASVGS